ncbi:N(4)-(beta-N-acetylglucosaminyl)-L-asparaginase [Atopobacter sp. AH10]|uniref:N(4)-(beta-N-acetylglucosaminyl)-L-asparaginase n=1 Tax=Atopobacter sp. AH10 TaxID=2315861 RepID=UPI000EF2411C|nr:N(4)-(beta-N-acetylglucosaminyl)-L-asparaginase [Atopobacter sp. AH10]RLK62648.1 N(4)-(beta-N-acetylglucosaminyl)-L-asparaginase [Atopobacter sp. AH10]
MYGMIGTWCMSLTGIQKAHLALKDSMGASKAVVQSISAVEDCPYFKSVGYGGLPNRNKEVELDAAFMDGNSLDFGAICAAKTIRNPIQVAYALSQLEANNFLAGPGADAYASDNGFTTGSLLTERASIFYNNRLIEESHPKPSVYRGHDTVGIIALDTSGRLAVGTSTSGLFMKEPGRVGDSPIIGAGLYADSDVGAACATGFGEDLLRGSISFAIIKEMSLGADPQSACERAVFSLEDLLIKRRSLARDLSVVAMNKFGEWGAASTNDQFSFVVAQKDLPPKVYLCKRKGQKIEHYLASEDWMSQYFKERQAPIEPIL